MKERECKLRLYKLNGKKVKMTDLMIFKTPTDCREMIRKLDFPMLNINPKKGVTYYDWG